MSNRNRKRKISEKIIIWLLACVVITFGLIVSLIYFSNTEIARTNTEKTLIKTLNDVSNDLDERDSLQMVLFAENLKNCTRQMYHEGKFANEFFDKFCRMNNISELSYVDSSGCIRCTNLKKLSNINLHSFTQFADFFTLLKKNSPEVYYPKHFTIGLDNVKRRYFGVKLSDVGGFILYGMTQESIYGMLLEMARPIAHHRSVGRNGAIFVSNQDNSIITATKGQDETSLNSIGISVKMLKRYKQKSIFKHQINGQ